MIHPFDTQQLSEKWVTKFSHNRSLAREREKERYAVVINQSAVVVPTETRELISNQALHSLACTTCTKDRLTACRVVSRLVYLSSSSYIGTY